MPADDFFPDIFPITFQTFRREVLLLILWETDRDLSDACSNQKLSWQTETMSCNTECKTRHED